MRMQTLTGRLELPDSTRAMTTLGSTDPHSTDSDPGHQGPSSKDEPMLTDADEDGADCVAEDTTNALAYDLEDDDMVGDGTGSVQSNPDRSKTPTITSETGKPFSGRKQQSMKRDSEPSDSHSLSHSKSEDKRVRKFVCRYCHKAFSLMNVLKVHERIHTGEKPYICEICDKAFNQSGSLNRHKNTHLKRSNDNRSYSCHYCPRQFLHSSQLQEHETTEHSTESNVRKSGIGDSVRCAYETAGKGTRQGLGDQALPELTGTQLSSMSNNSTTLTIPPPPPPPPLIQSSNSSGHSPDTPLRTFAAGLSLLQRAFASPDPMNKTHTGPGTDKSIEPRDTRLNGTASLPSTNSTNSGHINPNSATSTTALISNGTPFDTFSLGSNQCDLCSVKFANRIEFEHHLGQHFTQSLGFSLPHGFPNVSLDCPLGSRESLKQAGINANSDLLGAAMSLSSKIPAHSNPNELAYNRLVNLPDVLDSSNTLSSLTSHTSTDSTTTTTTNNLFPGVASAAALAALSQLMLTHSNPSAQTPILSQNNPAGLLAATAALTNPELLLLPDPTMLPSTTGPAGSFAQLLVKAMSSMSAHQASAPLLQPPPPPAPQPSHGNPLLPLFHNGADNTTDSESMQGLNLAVKSCSRLTPQMNHTHTTLPPTNIAGNATVIPAPSRKILQQNGTDTLPLPTAPTTLFPLHIPWFENPLGLDNLCKNSSTVSTVPSRTQPSGDFASDTRKSLPISPPTCSPGLGDSNAESKPTNLAIYGFEPDGFSDPDGSSSTGSMPGGLVTSKSSKPSGDHSPNSLHSNTRARQCDLCNKTFNCSSALRIHYRKHSGAPEPDGTKRDGGSGQNESSRSERPYQCKHCGNAFSQNGTLKRHLQTCKAASTRDRVPGSVQISENGVILSTGFKRHANRESVSEADLAKLDEIDGREMIPNENRSSRSSDASNSTASERESHSPATPVRAHIKRDPSNEFPMTNKPSDKRRKQQHQWISQFDQLSSSGATGDSVRKLDQTTAQLLLRQLQLSDWLHECADCQIYFIDQEMWLRHREQMHNRTRPDQPFVCAVCSQDLGNRLAFLTHFVNNHRTGTTELNVPTISISEHPVCQDESNGMDKDSSTVQSFPALENTMPRKDEPDPNTESMQPIDSLSPQSDSCPSPRSPSRPDSQTNDPCHPHHSPVRNLSVITDTNSIPSIISTES